MRGAVPLYEWSFQEWSFNEKLTQFHGSDIKCDDSVADNKLSGTSKSVIIRLLLSGWLNTRSARSGSRT